MITREIYDRISRKYGDVGSWAIWEEAGLKPKSNMGHLNVFDLEKNPSLLDTLKANVIMVGLNVSRSLIPTESFRNFHDISPRANDFKIRYAFKGTEFYGAYMTDVIKNLAVVDSGDVKKHLTSNPHLIEQNIAFFREELNDLEAKKPLIMAFGVDAYSILLNHLRSDEYSALLRLTHYSHQISKEKYKEEVQCLNGFMRKTEMG